ncbi:ABC transporter ATP-binding protein [Limnochorda pilosa]|uniref:Multidrug ABC transporter ATPase n=1 Tax=Limnochorda pilosa TaxID=1555112 RepID=A0A0K2SPA6_LIMPI|nr:ABC transporter ATP-binding protein [Limnochorda pilosa]BAS28832.1 multidrug ABC transporter ATPase [Limnochorda pilosa]
MHEFLALRTFFKRYWHRYALGILWLLAVDLLQLVTPRLLGLFADAYEQGHLTLDKAARYAGLILGVAVLIAIGRYFWRMYIMGTARLLDYTLRQQLFEHLQGLSPSFFDRHKTGDLMAHATNDVSAVRMAMGPGIVMAADSLFLTVATVISMVLVADWRLTLLALLPLPFLAWAVAHFGGQIHRRFRRVQEAFSALTDHVQENLAGIRVVRSFAQEEAEEAKFTEANRAYVRTNMHLVRVWALFQPLVQFVSGLGFVVVLGYGGTLVLRGHISLGDFVAFNSYLGMLTWPVMALGFVINHLQRGAASMGRLNVIFAQRSEVQEAKRPLDVARLRGSIEVRHLTFTYPGSPSPALRDVSFRLEPGQTLALVGRTGSGKSTLAQILLRLYDPPRGTVFLDGHDILDLPLARVREAIGYVSQESFLFSTSVAANIGFALEEPPPGRIEEASRIACIDEEVAALPHGYATEVGERGVTLSGGQRQRVAIARAVAKDPTILILDDALSAVDTQTEDRILSGLRDVIRSRTTILIAHRISTVQQADQILILDEGRVAERGTHLQLVARGGLYAWIHQRQLLEQSLAEEA